MPFLLKVISGPNTGTALPLSSTTLVGRGAKAQLKLTDPAVSWEHLLITHVGDDFFAENLSAQGTALNDSRLAAKTKLRLRDQLKLSDDTTLRIDPAAGASSHLFANPKFLLAAVGALIVILVVIFAFDPFSPRQNSPQMNRAYEKIESYVSLQVSTRRLPAEALTLLHDGWRLHNARDYKSAQQAWMQLELLLSKESESDPAFQRLADAHPTPLQRLLTAQPADKPLPDDEMTVASLQFAQRLHKFANAKNPQGGFFK